MSTRNWLTTVEAAQRLRLKRRTVYHLVESGRIPFSRAGGKLLFDPEQLDAWLASHAAAGAGGPEPVLPQTVAGSHDPLFEWALSASGCGLANACFGSTDGLDRLVDHRACAALLHLPDARTPGFNLEALQARAAQLPVVALHWARREQGLLLAPGNPLGIGGLSDLTRRGCRVALRQAGAGSNLLFARLMRLAGVGFAALSPIEPRASSESDMAAMIADDFADAGFGIRSAAVAARLEFIPLAWESVDLAMWRRQAFEPGLQALLAFCRGPRFAERARRLGGYDVSGHGRVVFNA